MRAHELIKELTAAGMPEHQAETIARVQTAYGDEPLAASDEAIAALTEAGLPPAQAGTIVRFRDQVRESAAQYAAAKQ